MNNLFSTFVAVLLLSIPIFSQVNSDEIDELIREGKEQQIVSENSRLMQEEFLYLADKLATKLMEFDSESCNYNYRKGFTTLYSKGDVLSAKNYFEKAIVTTTMNFDAYNKDEKSAPHDAIFHYAVCLHLLGDYDKAIGQFEDFKLKSREESELLVVADMKIKHCNNAKKEVDHSQIEPQNFQAVNTENADFAPLISLDGNLLFYTSRRNWENNETNIYRDIKKNETPEDIYLAQFNEESNFWETSLRLNFCLPKINESGLAISQDEREIILYSDSTGNGDLFHSKIMNGKFNDLDLKVDTALNTEFWETHATFSADGKSLYFTSDRDGGLGGRDIYVCAVNEDGSFGQAMNLGPNINSPYDEDAPFLSYDGKVLYYAANGDKSIGGFDILYSKLSNDGNWEQGVNMGTPYNSPFDDVFYTSTIDGKTAYYSSNRDGGKGNFDIYKVNNGKNTHTEIAVFKGNITTSTGEQIPEEVSLIFTLTCNDCGVKEQSINLSPRVRDGVFYSKLEPCKKYEIVLFNPGKNEYFHKEEFTTECDIAFQEIERDFIYDMDQKLIISEPEPVVIVDPILAVVEELEFVKYFGYNKTWVKETDIELTEILQVMETQLKEGRRDSLIISIYSSASRVPTKAYGGSNKKLAKARAEHLKNRIEAHFADKTDIKDKVVIRFTTVQVSGPKYRGDYKKRKKYEKYQFVGFTAE